MNYYRSSVSLLFYLTCCSAIFLGIQQPKPLHAINEAHPLQYLAQTPSPSPIDPLELLDDETYDQQMKAGYAAAREQEYEKALESFKKALEERPGDMYAEQAIQNMQTYLLKEQRSLKSPLSNPLLLGIVIVGGMGIIGVLVVFWLLNRRSQDPQNSFKEKNQQKNPFFGGEKTEDEPFKSRFSAEDRMDDHEELWDSSLPIHRTSRIPNPELIDELIQELQNPTPKKRRRAIWKLAQNADSRAMKPLVELMIDTDSYERNLILEALSQISARTIKPMNQALALSLQDKNPQVRKNAIRDLTRLYDMMSQVSQLLCHAIDDTDEEVQETAKWALNQLNLQMPPRLDLLLNRDNEEINTNGVGEDVYNEPSEVDY